jgi:hypothetical protein
MLRSITALQSAVNGQSLSQSGSEGLPGQQGMSSIAPAFKSAATCSLAAACMVMGTMVMGTAMTSRAIGAIKRPTIAAKARIRDKTRDTADSFAIKSTLPYFPANASSKKLVRELRTNELRAEGRHFLIMSGMRELQVASQRKDQNGS